VSARGVAAHAIVATLLLAGAAQATSRGPADGRRYVDVVASAQPSDQRRDDSDTVVDEVVVREADVKADAVSTSATSCHGCRGESAVLQVVYVTEPASARFDNVASAWTQDCWDCRATALSVQLIVIGPGTRARPTNRALSAGDACATCVTATAAFQVVAQVAALAEVTAWFEAQAAALRAAVVAPPAPRRAQRAADRSLGQLRRLVVHAFDGRTRSARVAVTR
jgi:hypothetical protein